MPDITSIGAALTGLKTAADIAKTLIDMKATAETQGKVIELQSVILAAQSSALDAQAAQSELLKQKRAAEEEVTRMKAWEAERQRYELHEPRQGTFTYRLKDGVEPPEPTHQICAHCYQSGQKSLLQSQQRMPGRSEVLMCPGCGNDIYIEGDWQPEHSGGKRRSSR